MQQSHVAVLTASISISAEEMGAIARIQPLSAHLHDDDASADREEIKQVYTVWMKSLVFNGHGCTIYGQDGRVAYRVDNYACSRSREVYVMDAAGKTLIKLLKKNFGVFKTWQGYSYCSSNATLQEEPWFSVHKEYKILKKGGRHGGNIRAVVRVAASGKVYTIDGAPHRSEYRVGDGADGAAVAEIRRKQTASGVALGEDVLSLTVGPAVDPLLVVGLVVVCGMLNRCI